VTAIGEAPFFHHKKLKPLENFAMLKREIFENRHGMPVREIVGSHSSEMDLPDFSPYSGRY
jgi:hypothetical protein